MKNNFYQAIPWPTANATGTTYASNGSLISTTPVSQVGPVSFERSDGSRTKNYIARVKAKELIPFTHYSYSRLDYIPGGRSYNWRRNDGVSYNVSGNLMYGGYQQLLPWDSVTLLAYANDKLKPPNGDLLLQKAAADCYQQGYDLLTALGEAGKTFEMIATLVPRIKEILRKEVADAKNLGKTIKALTRQLTNLYTLRDASIARKQWNAVRAQSASIRSLRRNLRDLSKKLDRLTSGYLEARYGWRPLISDMNSLAETLRNQQRFHRQIFVNHAQKTANVDVQSDVSMSGAPGTWTRSTQTTIYRSTRATVSADFDPSKWQINLPVTAWELVTLSFVVDWFISVGDAIKAASLLSLAYSVEAALSTHVIVEVRIADHKPVKASGFTSFNTSCNSSLLFEHKSRRPCGVPIVPQLQRKLDPYKIADLVSLGIQALKGRNLSRYRN